MWNYAFDIFEDEINNTNKTGYSYLDTYTEAISSFILLEEQKVRKMNKISGTKKTKDNNSGVVNSGNNKTTPELQM